MGKGGKTVARGRVRETSQAGKYRDTRTLHVTVTVTNTDPGLVLRAGLRRGVLAVLVPAAGAARHGAGRAARAALRDAVRPRPRVDGHGHSRICLWLLFAFIVTINITETVRVSSLRYQNAFIVLTSLMV